MNSERGFVERQYNIAVNIDWSTQRSSLFIAKCLLVFGVFLLPFGATVTNTFLLGSAGFTLLSGNWLEKWDSIAQQKTLKWILLFALLMIIGLFYSEGTSKHAWEGLSKYDKILYFILFLPLAVDTFFRRILINTLIIGTAMAVILGSDANPIDSGFIIGLTTFFLLRKIVDGRDGWLNRSLFIFLSVYLLFYNIERSGYLIYFGGLATIFWQVFRWRGIVFGAALILSLIASLYWLSPVFQSRIQLGISEAVSYVSEKSTQERAIAQQLGLIPIEKNDLFLEKNISLYDRYRENTGLLAQNEWLLNPHAQLRRSSIGLRLGFMQYSWQEIKKHFWLGNGTGSFSDVYSESGGPRIGDEPLGHPHNEYILILFQWGIFGLAIFLMWQITQWRESFSLPKPEKEMLQGLLICFALLGVCNASLYVNPSGDVFVILSAILLASKRYDRGKICELQ